MFLCCELLSEVKVWGHWIRKKSIKPISNKYHRCFVSLNIVSQYRNHHLLSWFCKSNQIIIKRILSFNSIYIYTRLNKIRVNWILKEITRHKFSRLFMIRCKAMIFLIECNTINHFKYYEFHGKISKFLIIPNRSPTDWSYGGCVCVCLFEYLTHKMYANLIQLLKQLQQFCSCYIRLW